MKIELKEIKKAEDRLNSYKTYNFVHHLYKKKIQSILYHLKNKKRHSIADKKEFNKILKIFKEWDEMIKSWD